MVASYGDWAASTREVPGFAPPPRDGFALSRGEFVEPETPAVAPRKEQQEKTVGLERFFFLDDADKRLVARRGDRNMRGSGWPQDRVSS
jgi:hypothetical protein